MRCIQSYMSRINALSTYAPPGDVHRFRRQALQIELAQGLILPPRGWAPSFPWPFANRKMLGYPALPSIPS
jgi:hypothetical protein